MGMGYLRAEFVLNGFVRFVRDQYGKRSVSLERAVSEWVVRIEGRKAEPIGPALADPDIFDAAVRSHKADEEQARKFP